MGRVLPARRRARHQRDRAGLGAGSLARRLAGGRHRAGPGRAGAGALAAPVAVGDRARDRSAWSPVRAGRRTCGPGGRLDGDSSGVLAGGVLAVLTVAGASSSPPCSRRRGPVVGRPPHQRRGHRRHPRVGHVHRLAPRADLDAATARRARRGRAGAPDGPGARQRTLPDRPRDARRARAPDLPDLSSGGRARLPQRPRRRRAAGQRDRDPRPRQRSADRPAWRARGAPRPRYG